MEFLQSNYPPVRTGGRTFLDTFYGLLPQTEELSIAVGYVTADSLVELRQIAEMNHLEKLNLTIGMHYPDGFTRVEYNAARRLNDYLTETGKGHVSLVTAFRYHGKLYSYSDRNGAFAGIIGSNNLSSIVEGGSRVYESAFLLDNRREAEAMHSFIAHLNRDAAEIISECDITRFKNNNPVLEGHENVRRVEPVEMYECLQARTPLSFEIPLKGAEVSAQSNLNVFFGRGRVGVNGLVKPRHWYEVELIVPNTISLLPGYPRARTDEAVFDVITDDGWSFACKVSGDYNKNFRSEGDLKILGKWIKGRLENAGALTVGEPVTQDTFRRYGRNTFTLTKTSIPNTWYLDFGVRE